MLRAVTHGACSARLHARKPISCGWRHGCRSRDKPATSAARCLRHSEAKPAAMTRSHCKSGLAMVQLCEASALLLLGA